jgi:hypothetical protein
MIEKIISGGRPGAEQAALDASIKLGIGYGGWIPKGGSSRDPVHADKYNLVEMTATDQTETLTRHIRESDGTLIFSHGALSADLANTTRIIQRFSAPLLHVDLNLTGAFNAASLINDWVVDNDLRILHVTGISQNKADIIYPSALDILQAVYFLNLTETGMKQPMGVYEPQSKFLNMELRPKTAEAAVDIIINEMQLKDRILMANLREEEIASLQFTIGPYIKKKLDLWSQDATLGLSFAAAAEKEKLDRLNLPMVLIKMMWKKLKDTHRLRVVK